MKTKETTALALPKREIPEPPTPYHGGELSAPPTALQRLGTLRGLCRRTPEVR